MATMATPLKDIQHQFRYELSGLPAVVASYCTVQFAPLRVRVWTLLDARHEDTERALAIAERKLRDSFTMVTFDFNTTHLRDRDPVQFIPEGALNILARHSAVAEHFSRAVSAA